MDIASISMSMSQSKIMEQTQISVMKMSMESSRETGAQITEMIDSASIDTAKGNMIDLRV